MTDPIDKADAIEAVLTYFIPRSHTGERGEHEEDFVRTIFNALPSADAEKKKAELKENGDWDCPDVDCDECDHHRSVEWCSLAIPNHEKEIDETYKMVNEAFFEGFDAAEKRYRFLIETVEELDKKLADAVHGEWEHWGSPFSDESEVIDTIVCSVCGARFIEPKDEPKGEYNFCPNCGARMEKGVQNEILCRR